jgi:hypothetical protein
MDMCYEAMQAYVSLSGGSIEPVEGTLYKRVVTPKYTMLMRPVVYGYDWELTDIYNSDGWECYSYRYDYGEMSCNTEPEDRLEVDYLLTLLHTMRDLFY